MQLQALCTSETEDDTSIQSNVSEGKDKNAEDHVIGVKEDKVAHIVEDITGDAMSVNVDCKYEGIAQFTTSFGTEVSDTTAASLQLFDLSGIGNWPPERTAFIRDSILQAGPPKPPPSFVCLFCFVGHFYPPFTRKRIVLLYFGREVRTRLGVTFFEVSGPPVFHVKVGRPVKCLAQGHNKRTYRLVLHNLP